MKLYHYALSGHAHRAALFLSLAGVAHELIEVDLAVGAHKQPEFLAINAFGEVPVLDDGGVIISDSLAILVYIARKIGPSHWLPTDAADEARVQRWLSVAAGKIAYGACAARLITVFGATFNAKEVIERAHATLTVMEQTLQTQRWIAGAEDPSIADVALYSYVERAPEGNVDLSGYPKVQAWLRDIECLPGFTPFQRSQAGLHTPNEPPSSDAINLSFDKLRLDHIGLRVTDLGVAEAFYAKLGFKRDPEEFAPEFKASGLVHPTGLRLHLIYNGEAAEEGNVLLDAPIKWPGYTHAAFIVDSMAELVRWLHSEGINISQGPVTMGRGRRNVCFIRDPDLNVLEFNEILEA